MKIELKALVRPIYLRDYAQEYGDEVVYVWVNPPRRLRLEFFDVTAEFAGVLEQRAKAAAAETPDAEVVAGFDRRLEELAQSLYGWFAQLWSQHEDAETHWTTEDVVQLMETCQDADPRLWSWLQDETWRLMTEHRDGVKKS